MRVFLTFIAKSLIFHRYHKKSALAGAFLQMVLSARFERTTYRLGGGRSIQLSYESEMETSDSVSRNLGCQTTKKRGRSRIVGDERSHIVSIELFSAVEEVQLDNE